MSDFTEPLNGLAAELGALKPNSTVNAADSNNFTFNINPVNNFAVFNVPVSELATATTLSSTTCRRPTPSSSM